MCVVKRSVALKDLQKTARYLQHTRMYYEPHTSKKEAIQCYKCQQWGHTTANCYLPVECTLPRDRRRNAATVASAPKYSVYLKFVENRGQRKLKNGAASAARAARNVPAPPPKVNTWDRNDIPHSPRNKRRHRIDRSLLNDQPLDLHDLQRWTKICNA